MRNFSRSLLLVGSIALVGGLAACGDDVTVAPPQTQTPQVRGVAVAPSTGQVRIGSSLQLTASVSADSGATANVAWSTSDATIATVDQTGKVTGIKAGTVGITAKATAANGSTASGTATITVVAGGNVQTIVLNPTSVTLTVGNKQAINATVTLDPSSTSTDRGVTWSSSNTAVATVDATGTVTAVAAGTATITARANADTTATQNATVTVRNAVPTSISVQSITVTGNLQQTVNVNNVAGSIDVTLNVDPGENTVSRVEVLLDGNVVCSQSFGAAQNQALSAAAANLAAAPVPVVCQINTAQFNDTTGAVRFFNGQHVLSARAITSTGQQVATPSTNLQFNNQSGVVVGVAAAKSGVNPLTGLAWQGGDITVNFVGVSYICSAALTNGQCATGSQLAFTNASLTGLFGKGPQVALTNNTGSVTYSAGTIWTPANTGIGNYLSPTTGESAAGATITLSNGQNLIVTAPFNGILNFGAPAIGNATIPALQVLRVDNNAPGVIPANAPGNPGSNLVAGTNYTAPNLVTAAALPTFVGGTFTFPGQIKASTLAVPPVAAALNTLDMGVDSVTVKFYTAPVGTFASFTPGNAPGNGIVTQPTPSSAAACTIPAGATLITDPATQLQNTQVSTTLQARAVITDKLGNQTCVDFTSSNANGSFGVDFVPPTVVSSTGAANQSIFNIQNAAGLPPYVLSLTDIGTNGGGSGIPANPLQISVSVATPNGTTCVYGTAACAPTAYTGGTTFNPLNPAGGAFTPIEGYYTVTVTATDNAGNVAQVFTRTFLYDITRPMFTGNVGLQNAYQGMQPALFTVTPNDNIDLGFMQGIISYNGGINIQYQTQTLGTAFDGTFDVGGQQVSYTVSNFIRCLNPTPNDFSNANNRAQAVSFDLFDAASNSATAATAPAQIGSNVTGCGTVGDLATADILSFQTQTTILYDGGTTKTSVSNGSGTKLSTAGSTVSLEAVASVALNTSANPFPTVNFYWVDNAGRLRLIGPATIGLTQDQTTRLWHYTLTWTPPATIPLGTVNIVAIGVDTEGDAVLANTLGSISIQVTP